MKRWAIAIVLLSIQTAWAAPKSRVESLFPSCGVYRVVGRVECRGTSCGLMLFPGSRSELKADLLVQDPKIIQQQFQGKNVQLKVSYAGPTPFVLKALDLVPRRARPSQGTRAIQLEEEEECHANP